MHRKLDGEQYRYQKTVMETLLCLVYVVHARWFCGNKNTAARNNKKQKTIHYRSTDSFYTCKNNNINTQQHWHLRIKKVQQPSSTYHQKSVVAVLKPETENINHQVKFSNLKTGFRPVLSH